MRTNAPGGIAVVGVRRTGERVARVVLPHGTQPEQALAGQGWHAESPIAATLSTRPDRSAHPDRPSSDAHPALELSYLVSELSGIPPHGWGDVPRDPDVLPEEVGEPHQRVAAYAVVTSVHGVLLTQFNTNTNVPGTWGLPGGGLDECESPVDGVHREVWEETGQRIELGELLTIQSQHWVGRAPSGQVEDFHAVRIVYAATCPEPVDIIIHDVGGTTADARWVRPDELDRVPMTASWRGLEALSALAEGGPDA